MSKQKKIKEKGKGIFQEFKTFINKGNAFMLAVGVVIGSAFTAIINSFVAILMSVATWAVPGGIDGLVSVLPASNNSQAGILDATGKVVVGNCFTTNDLDAVTRAYADFLGKEVVDASGKQTDLYATVQADLLSKYNVYGGTYAYKSAAVVNWGALINAIISFLIVAIVLFIIVKIVNMISKKNEELKAKALEAYYEKHPEERPVPPEPGKPEPTQEELLAAILKELKIANGTEEVEEPKPAE